MSTHYVSKNHEPYHLTQLRSCAHKTQLLYTNVCLVLAAKIQGMGTSLVVWQLGLCNPNAGGVGSIPAQGDRSHISELKILHATAKIEDPECSSKTWHSQIFLKSVPAG